MVIVLLLLFSHLIHTRLTSGLMDLDSLHLYVFKILFKIKSFFCVLKIYSHKTKQNKNFNVFFYCYVHQLTYQNTIFRHYLVD